eukprot:gene17552-24358_t
MITPMYSCPVHDFVGIKDLTLFSRVAMCTLLSIRAFNGIKYCHGDIKPNNLMLMTVKIDFGESAAYGTDIMKELPDYPLDCIRKEIDSLKSRTSNQFITKIKERSSCPGLIKETILGCLTITELPELINQIFDHTSKYLTEESLNN